MPRIERLPSVDVMPGASRDNLLHRLGRSGPIGLAAFDAKLRYLAVNEYLAELNGNTVAEHVGKTLREMRPDLADRLEPIIEEIFAGGQPVYGIPLVVSHQVTGETQWSEVSFFGLDDPHGRRTTVGCVVVDTTERERALSRVGHLQDAITAVTAASDATVAAQALVDNALHAVGAQGTGIAFVDDDGDLEFVAVAGEFGDVIMQHVPRIRITAAAPATDAFRTGQAIWLPTRRAWRSAYPFGSFLIDHGARAVFVAPLEAAVTGRRLGILGVVFSYEPQLDEQDLGVVTAFAHQAAEALERIMLHDSERLLRERFQILAALGARLDEEIEPLARMETFLDVVVPSFASASEVEFERESSEPLRADRAAFPDTASLELLRLPLVAQGESFGSVTFARPDFSAGDHVLATELARRLANALENARLYARERRLAESLQLSLLPREVPTVAGATVWARYLPGSDLVVGGDFWDVIPLGCQRLLLVVGDVAGRGERAAIVMGRIRTVIRAVADTEVAPAVLIRELNRFLVEHEDEMATCVCAILDQTTGEVRVASGGHLPVLRVDGTGATSYLGGATGIPLGVLQYAPYAEERFFVEPGEMLVLFTDGLVERRGESIDARLEFLAEQVRANVPSDGAWCDHVVDAMIGSRRDDDVAVLGIRVDARCTPALAIEIPAERRNLRVIREQLRTFFARATSTRPTSTRSCSRSGEAAANVAMHAYGPRGGALRIDAVLGVSELGGPELAVRVCDDGRWRPPRDGEGRGLHIINELADSMRVEKNDAGTTVAFTLRLSSAQPTAGYSPTRPGSEQTNR